MIKIATAFLISAFGVLPALADNAATIIDVVPHYTEIPKMHKVCYESDSGDFLSGAIAGAVVGKMITKKDNGAIIGAIIGGSAANSRQCQNEVEYVEGIDYYEVSYSFRHNVYIIDTPRYYSIGDRVPLAYLLNKY